MVKRWVQIIVAGVLMATGIELYVWVHHIFVIGLNPFVADIILFLAVLLVILLMAWTVRKFRWPVWQLFAVGAVSWIWRVLFWRLWLLHATLDIHLHDTYYVISGLPCLTIFPVIMIVFTGIYYLMERKGHVNKILGRIHFWVSFVGFWFILWPRYYELPAGAPRRYFDYGGWYNNYPGFVQMNGMITAVVLATVVMQLVFLAMVVYYLARKFLV